MKYKNPIGYIILVLLLLFNAFTLYGNNTKRPISASLDSGTTIELDGKHILKRSPVVVYRRDTYVPIEEFAKELGYTVKINGSRISLTSPNTSNGNNTPSQDANQTITSMIVAVNYADKTITLAPSTQANTKEQTVIYITDATNITDGKSKVRLTINDLTPDQIVSVTYNVRSTKSIPPQTQNIASEIIIQNAPMKPQPR